MTLNYFSSCLYLPNTRLTGTRHQDFLLLELLSKTSANFLPLNASQNGQCHF